MIQLLFSFRSFASIASASALLSASIAGSTNYEAPIAPSAEVQAVAPTPAPPPARAKNVILLVSDGIGFNGWLAADYYQGKAGAQSYQVTRPDGTKPVLLGMAHSSLNLIDAQGHILPSASDIKLAKGAVEQGYDPRTRWERLENTFVGDFGPDGKSYTTYTDSAAAGTALMTGRKTANGRINMDWSASERFTTIAQIAMNRKRSAGAVSSVMASHATPAAVIAHNVSRNNYSEIFTEMVGSDLNVIMGGGHPGYDSSGQNVIPGPNGSQFVGGDETFANLVGHDETDGFRFIDSKSQFENLAAGRNLPQRVVGIARTGSTLQATREDMGEGDTPSGMAYNLNVPDLPTMSLGALNVLNQDEDGFFLMIEGGAIDWMGHANNMERYIEEQIDFNRTVDAVIDWVETNSSWDETLVIITSDHECGGIWGEGTWTNSVGGPVAAERTPEALTAARFDPADDTFNAYLAVQDRGAGQIPGYQFASGNHTNELVPLWAIGNGSEMFAQYTRTDIRARDLWGKPYDWNGHYVDNTTVFYVMEMALRE